MLKPVHTPLEAGDRITQLASALVCGLSPALVLTSLAVRRYGSVESIVVIHLPDGGREPVSADQARELGRALRRHELGNEREADWADSLDEAADQAERQASAILLGLDVGAYVGAASPREFRGRP